MKRLLYYSPNKGTPPLRSFLSSLNPKLRAKMDSLFQMVAVTPTGLLHEPHVKHFTIERYNTLYELRAKGKTLVRIIFTILPGGDILFLMPFVKNHKRNTMQALETSLKMLSQIGDDSGLIQELTTGRLEK